MQKFWQWKKSPSIIYFWLIKKLLNFVYVYALKMSDQETEKMVFKPKKRKNLRQRRDSDEEETAEAHEVIT